MLLLVATISFAAILDYYVKAQGTAEVRRPHFYIGSAVEEILLIDEKPGNCSHFYLQNSYTRSFATEENFQGIDFDYVPDAKFFIRVKVKNNIGTTTPQNLYLKFGYIDLNGQPVAICSASVIVDDTMDDYTPSPVQCSSKPQNVKHFFYEMMGDCSDCSYTISKCAGGFYTKVELDK